MRRTATSIRVLVSASVLLVVVGASPAAATHSPTRSLEQQGLAAFEWYRLSQGQRERQRRAAVVAASRRLHRGLRRHREWLEAADQPESWSQRRRLRRLAGDLRRFVAR